jgi:diguanylate cyclase (GGDEF)-like protein
VSEAASHPPIATARAIAGYSIERRLTVAYLLALTIVALLTVVSHLTLEHALRTHDGSAAVINISGRQRMLSQRIASLAAQYALGDAGIRPSLQAALVQFEAAHRRLIDGDASMGLPPAEASPELRAIYFGGPDPLDTQVGRFCAETSAVLALAPGAPAMKPILAALFAQAQSRLLTGLERVVTAHQRTSEAQLRRLRQIQDTTLTVILVTLMIEALGIFRPMVRRISRYAGQLITLATVDSLTGLLNRRSFFERGEAAYADARRGQRPLSVLMIDADHFKRINDTHSHAAGDAVLRALAATLRQEVRGADLVARIGGEEFAVLLPEAGLVSAQQTAERLRSVIASRPVRFASGDIALTVSIGLAVGAGVDSDLASLLARADRALYAAKANGRDRIECAA